jgi:ABC-type transporter Mla maintaining outer membrane lipid asymmetry permease subunit MlaE
MADTHIAKSQSTHAKPLFVSLFEWFGELGIFCRRMVHGAFTPPYEVKEFIRQLDAVGSLSLPLVAIVGAATGVAYLSRRATV